MTSISLLFIRPLALYETTKPYTFHELPANVSEEERSNVENIKAGNIHVIDARTLADNELSYEDHRFRFVKHEASSTYSFSTEPDLLREYCKKIIGLVSEEFEAERVLCYDIRVRLLLSYSERSQMYYTNGAAGSACAQDLNRIC